MGYNSTDLNSRYLAGSSLQTKSQQEEEREVSNSLCIASISDFERNGDRVYGRQKSIDIV